MPKPLSLASVIESNRLSSDVPFLCLIDLEIVNPATGSVVATEYIARNSEPVVFEGRTYGLGTFDIQIKQETGSLAEVTLTVNDYTQHIQGLMEEFGGGVGSKVTLYVVNSGNLAQGAEIVEFFEITAASSADYVQSFTLGAENALAQTFPRRRQTRDFCQWRFKDPKTCGYVGPLTSCALTLQGANGCEAHDNSINFGGYPGLNQNGYRYA